MPGAEPNDRISSPPPGAVAWVVWAKGAPDERGAIVVYAQLWHEAWRAGCRALGVPDVDGRRARPEEDRRACA